MTESIQRFGYTLREAEFLGIAAPVSGYFMRRHFNEFIGRACGALAQRFIEKCLRLGHIETLRSSEKHVVYHAHTISLYAALGDAESRNRRAHRPETIRRRLMALDFCLSGNSARVIPTESEKLAHFAGTGLVAGTLAEDSSTRVFLDKQPISLCENGTTEFAFINSGFRTLSHWGLFLKEHRSLLQRLDKAVVVYAGCDRSTFNAAERMFRRVVTGETEGGRSDLGRLREYFSSRQLAEQGHYGSFDQSRLDELREAKRVFSGRVFDELYNRWRDTGELAPTDGHRRHVEFRTEELPHFYEWLSPILIPERRANALNRIAAEKESGGRHGQTRHVHN